MLDVFFEKHEILISILSELKPKIKECLKSLNANHVVLKLLDTINAEIMEFILKEVNEQAKSLSSHQYGCRII